jgi:four helix bundle protein
VRLFRTLPRAGEARVIGNQLLRSGTSVAANYRSLLRARSRREFIARAGVVVEEADESLFWLELLEDLQIASRATVQPLRSEANEFIAILVAARATARKRQ